jgi:hypothetical protein
MPKQLSCNNVMRLPKHFFIATATALLSLTSVPVRAATIFGTQGIRFDQDTPVDFTFDGSNGAYQSTLKIFEDGASLNDLFTVFTETKASDNGADNGFQGTCGNTVLVCTKSFTFKGGVTYSLGLESLFNGQPANPPVVYSTSSLNTSSGGSQQAIFGTFVPTAADGTPMSINAALFQSADPFAGPVKIAFDDRGNGNDRDFNDFRITAVATTVAPAKEVPEPAALSGLGLVVGALTFMSRRNQGKQLG